jgi:CPA1 family monovalent cation:H+ antiporter
VAEEFHFSGVLAVVITGLLLGHKRFLVQSASSRIFEQTNWRTIEFILENTVFLLIGLQVRQILMATDDSSLSGAEIAGVCAAVVLTVIVARPVWVFPSTYLPRLIPSIRARDPMPPWTYPAAVSWAGMRGVVTLAAAFVLPEDTPEREVLILVALVVVGATLLVQGATLPWVLRKLRLSGPDPAEDALQAASVQQRATNAGMVRLDEVAGDDVPPEILKRIKMRSKERSQALWERLGGSDETPSQLYSRLRIEMIDAERAELIRLRDDGVVPDDIMRRVIAAIDIEETILDRGEDYWSTAEREADLVPPATHPSCEHIDAITTTPSPNTPEGCEECLRDGTTWVHLRLCFACGHVGCCDSSPQRHASRHYQEVKHPVMRSFEPGEAWKWCFVDNVLG